MSTDPCVPTDHLSAGSSAAVPHRAPHHVLGRPRPRVHHTQFHAIPPAHDAGACGKVYASGTSGPLAARPLGGAPAKAGLAKLAGLAGAGKAASASIAAAALVGALAALPGLTGSQHAAPVATSQPAGTAAPSGGPSGGQSALPSPVLPPGSGQPPGAHGTPSSPPVVPPSSGTAVPEPASLLLLLAAVGAALAARGLRRRPSRG